MQSQMSTSPMPEDLTTVFHEAVPFLARSKESGGIYGLTGSASSFLTAAAVAQGARNIVMVFADGETAAAAAGNVRFYLGAEKLAEEPLLDPVLPYPSSDAVPYSSAAYETEVTYGRMAALYRLAASGAPKVLMVGLDALVRRIIPRDAVLDNSFSLKVGDEIDRESLLQRLVEAGYSRSPLVEDAGEFSVRGFVVDVYPPVYPYPLRIAQMGDEIESIRFFDPTNQRSKEDIAELSICPIRMVLPAGPQLDRGLATILERCEELGVEKRIRQRLLDDLRLGVRFPGSECYIPYFFPKLESLIDYLPPDSTIIVPDDDTMARALEETADEVLKGWDSACAEGLPAPRPEELYLFRHEVEHRLGKFRTVIMSQLDMEKPGRRSFRLRCRSNADIREDLIKAKGYDSGMAGLVKRLGDWREDGNEVFLVSHTIGQANRLINLLEPYDLRVDYRGEGFDTSNLTSDPTPGIRLYVGELSSGFRLEEARRVVLTEEEIFGSRVRAPRKKRARGAFIPSLTDLAEGEAVVHEDYGIGIFRGLSLKEFDGVRGEVMVIEYAGGDLLYHPVERLHCVQKYVSGSEAPPRIDRLGGKGWIKTKAKVKNSIREMTRELLDLYARRQVARRTPYTPRDETFAAFEAAFEFEETPDQAAAIQDVMNSLDSDKPMDRLVCGDVGYGKTEVALRAAFRVMMDGRQVAILVPTTVLAQQHYDTVKRRFNGYPFNVDVISRFRSAGEQKDIVSGLANGKIDLIIGTHRLLSKDVAFKDLGLLVLDEEHRFGVAHKEKIKQYKSQVDVLTLTATPIPRTLNMSLTGIRDLSVIETPPTNRKSIRTHLMRQSDEVIRDAILRELSRNGQVFFLHNRVRDIFRRAAALKQLVPEGRFGVAHGQMSDRELERVMLDFVTGQINVLVCTSIIESGLDIPRANTIIIERADALGLADLYQLRGRVGRSGVRAYAYLLTPSETLISPDAIKRLAVIQEHSDLGQGFRIAMRDLEIRGAGNMLGQSQSGHVALVGYEMYLTLLEQAVKEMKGEEPPPPEFDPEIRLRVEALIPEAYVPDPRQRMNLYKRLSRAGESKEIDDIEEEILDLYGPAPAQLANLVRVMRLRLLMKKLRVKRIDYAKRDLIITFDSQTPIRPELLVRWAQSEPEKIRLLPGDRMMYRVGRVDDRERIDLSFNVMASLLRTLDAESSLRRGTAVS